MCCRLNGLNYTCTLQILLNPYHHYPFYLLGKATEFKCVLFLSNLNTHTTQSFLYSFLVFDTEHKGEKAQQPCLMTLICTDLKNTESSLLSYFYSVSCGANFPLTSLL